MLINHKIEFVEGAFDTQVDELVCVKSQSRCQVLICVKANMNVPIAEIKLHSRDSYLDAHATLKDAFNLGEEIVKRWNAYNKSLQGNGNDFTLPKGNSN